MYSFLVAENPILMCLWWYWNDRSDRSFS